jgi:hypothetical protein
MARPVAVLATLVLLAGTVPVHAQLLGPDDQPGPLVREALASPYGRALLTELGKRLRESADPACLQSKGLAPEQLSARGGALIETWGSRGLEKAASFFDIKAQEEKFAASAGPKAKSEFAKLRQTAEVKRYLALQRPIRLAGLLEYLFEQFDRWVLLSRLKLNPVSPLPTGNIELANANPSEAAEAALEKYVASTKSSSLRRYLALAEKFAAAQTPAVTLEQAATLIVPKVYFGGVEDELAALCIGKR